MALSKRSRFEVFKRDGFVCQYCGRTPPDVVLHVDHINPSSAGGGDEIDNLLTSCACCNLGKSDVPLDQIPQTMIDKLEVLKEKQEQLAAYNKLLRRQNLRFRREAGRIDEIYSSYFPGWQLSERFKRVSLRTFLQRLPCEVVTEYMELGYARFPHDPDRSIRYFCGCCWKRIKGGSDDGQG